MDPLTDRLLRLLHAHHGWRRCLLLVQEAGGRVGWVKLPCGSFLAKCVYGRVARGTSLPSGPDSGFAVRSTPLPTT